MRAAVQGNRFTHTTRERRRAAQASAALGFDAAFLGEPALHQRQGLGDCLAVPAIGADTFQDNRVRPTRIVDLFQPMIELRNLGLHLFGHH